VSALIGIFESVFALEPTSTFYTNFFGRRGIILGLIVSYSIGGIRIHVFAFLTVQIVDWEFVAKSLR